jgi:hypothetical protein
MPVSRFSLIVVCAALTLALVAGIAVEARQRPSFRVGVDLVMLNVTVRTEPLHA